MFKFNNLNVFKLIDKSIIIKKNKYNNKKIKLFKKIDETKIDEIYKGYIKEFIEILIVNNANFDYNLFEKNINTLVIDFFENSSIYRGHYVVKDNKILLNLELDDKEQKKVFFHELLHMLGTKYYKDNVYTGFKKNNLFTGINEGYTQLLTKRYFNDNNNGYIIEENIASIIEMIIGTNKMEYLYSNAKYDKLIIELDKYNNNLEDTFNLILDIDKIYNNHLCILLDDDNIYIDHIVKSLKKILLKLMDIFLNKIKIDDVNYNYFLDKLSRYIIINGEKFQVLTDEEFDMYRNKCIEISELKINKNKIKIL